METLQLDGVALPATVIPFLTEAVTFITVTYRERRYRFSVSGVEPPFEVAFLVEFDAPGIDRASWFSIAPEQAVTGELLQQRLFAQLVDVHRASQHMTRGMAERTQASAQEHAH